MKRVQTILIPLALALLFGVACDQSIEGQLNEHQRPRVFISSAPPDGDLNTNYKVQFYWNGYDPDGRISHFQYLITDDEVTGSLLIDDGIYDALADLGYEWATISVHDSVFIVSADSIPNTSNPADSIYLYGDRFLFRAQHTFFIRAVDERSAFSRIPEHRTFTATTIAPEVRIIHPADIGGGGGFDDLPPDIFFRWSGNDSVGDGTVLQQADSTRFALLNRGELGISLETNGRMLNFPDSVWSIWRHWEQEDSLNENIGGSKTLVTGLTPFNEYMMFVQAKDEAGAITSHFRDGSNLRKFRVISSLQPSLVVRERAIGTRVSDHNQDFSFTIAEGQPLQLTWRGSAEVYGSEVTGYRYGWDILDTANDDEWSNWSQSNLSTENSFASGTHTLHLEARDFSGNKTRLRFDFFVIPFSMEQELLFIDDYDNRSSNNPGASWPDGLAQNSWGTYFHTSGQMRTWWDTVLDPYVGYFSDRDFFEVTPTADKPPIERVANYKRLIWEVKPGDNGSGIGRVSMFIDTYVDGAQIPFDFLSAYMDRGGQVLLCGSRPVFATIPPITLMGTVGYTRRGPFSFLRHLGYSEGAPEESAAAIRRYLFWDKFGLDTVSKPVDQQPRAGISGTGPDFSTFSTFWGMTGARYAGLELTDFPNTQPALPDTIRFKPRVYEWFHAAGGFYTNQQSANWYPDPADPNAQHFEYGLAEVEIYNWNWAAVKLETQSRPNLYRPLLYYVPADSTTRWGAAPAAEHIQWTINHDRYSETRYSLASSNRKHIVGIVSMVDPASPSVLLGFSPYFLEDGAGYNLIDHIMIDILNMTK